MHSPSLPLLFGSVLIVTALADDVGTSPWSRGLNSIIAARANKEYVRKQQQDPYCPDAWMLDYLKVKDKQFSAPWEVYMPEAPEDGLVCEYAISPENKAMVITDADGSSAEEMYACYRDSLLANMKDKLGAQNARTIIAADLVNNELRDAVEAGIQAAGKNPKVDNAVTIKYGEKGWNEFYNNAVVTGVLNTLCESGKSEMGSPKLKHFVAVSKKTNNAAKPDLHIVTVLE